MLQNDELHKTVGSIISMANTLASLSKDSLLGPDHSGYAEAFMEGRSRRRRRRRRRDDTSSDEDEYPHIYGNKQDSISRTVVPVKIRIDDLTRDLLGHVRVLRDGIENMVNEGEQAVDAKEVREMWHVLLFALQDWR